MAFLSRNPGRETLSLQPFGPTTRLLQRRLARPLAIPATGSTRLGLILVGFTASFSIINHSPSVDLKEWLDSHGIPAPQPTTRDKLVASVRRNARIASLKAADLQASVSKSAAAAAKTVSDALLDSWSDSRKSRYFQADRINANNLVTEIKEWADKNGIKVPQGSKRNELLAIARKHRAQLTGDNVSYSAKSAASKASASGESAFGAATSKAGNQFAKATDDAQLVAEDAFNSAISTWSASRLKSYLDSRGVPVPQSGKKDELLAAVRLNRHKAATGWSAWTFDTWTVDNLKKYLAASGNKAAEKASNQAGATREQLMSAAQDAYSSASKTGGSGYASLTSYLAMQTDAAKGSVFDTWSESGMSPCRIPSACQLTLLRSQKLP